MNNLSTKCQFAREQSDRYAGLSAGSGISYNTAGHFDRYIRVPLYPASVRLFDRTTEPLGQSPHDSQCDFSLLAASTSRP